MARVIRSPYILDQADHKHDAAIAARYEILKAIVADRPGIDSRIASSRRDLEAGDNLPRESKAHKALVSAVDHADAELRTWAESNAEMRRIETTERRALGLPWLSHADRSYNRATSMKISELRADADRLESTLVAEHPPVANRPTIATPTEPAERPAAIEGIGGIATAAEIASYQDVSPGRTVVDHKRSVDPLPLAFI